MDCNRTDKNGKCNCVPSDCLGIWNSTSTHYSNQQVRDLYSNLSLAWLAEFPDKDLVSMIIPQGSCARVCLAAGVMFHASSIY